MSATATEKILSRATGRQVRAGEIVYPEPDLITVHDWYVVNFDKVLSELGVERVLHPEKVLISTDHEPVAVSVQAAERQRKVREIVARHGISRFFDAGKGGQGHMFPMELGLVAPGMFVFAYDIHVTNYGAIGCLGIPLVTEISEVLACGNAWIRVPETVRVEFTGSLQRGVSVRDVAQRLIADLGPEIVDYSVVEFAGPGLSGIDVDRRMTLCNTPIEIGAKSALVEVDDVTRAWLDGRLDRPWEPQSSDPDATFKAVIPYDLGLTEPQVAAPPTPDNVKGVSELVGKQIDYAFIGSCASSSIGDMRDAARILKGRKVADRVRLFVTPGTHEVAQQAAKEGILETLFSAGAAVTAPGCGPCAGGRIGALAPGEVSINTGTRNDFGRLGPRNAEIYLGSPLTVAASAVAGRITDPRDLL